MEGGARRLIRVCGDVMNFYIMTLFPEMVMDVLNTSILKRAIDKGTIFAKAVNIRDYANNKHNKVDDYTYGGGAGMLMQAQPIYDCYKAILEEIREKNPNANPRVIYVTPQGKVFSQGMARELSQSEDLIFLCGHYEGIDERVLEEIVTDYISIGDYVLTGGELPAMVMIDAVSRLVPGVLNNEESAETESFDDGLLEYPQYSRPEIWMDKKVPPVLLSGNHANVDVWRFQKSLERTKERRPELYDKYVEEHPEQFTAKALKKRNKILDKIEENS
jgi:tRNA (guanine37-N1)-methyltransferase|nr:tRNA (guanosine(37)-N1)-methyltransferase TrmD [Butyrivibrio sp. XPD2002]